MCICTITTPNCFILRQMKKHNFNSGPSVLPQEVLQQAAEAVISYNTTGLSLLEIGHRTNWFVEIIEEAKTLVKELMQLNDTYEVLFLHGGATTQFMQIPMNLLDANETAAYCNNGIWGKKAIAEAKLFGNVDVVSDSSANHHTHIPKNFSINNTYKYLHLTTNNTVEGTQWHQFPATTIPIVADMSSDIFSKQINFNQFALIYAGAQKNIGAAGVTLVVIKKELTNNITKSIPAIMNYKNHIEAGSLLNTPPVFAIYVALLTLRWIKKEGGLLEMEKRSISKSTLLYNTIDSLPLFKCYVNKEDRSRMNAVFFIENEQLQSQFLDICKENGMVGVKGYRTVGGIRVSMYNALAYESVVAITDLMKDFANKNS